MRNNKQKLDLKQFAKRMIDLSAEETENIINILKDEFGIEPKKLKPIKNEK